MARKYAITIGKFEALHLGHAHLINTTIEYANKNGLASAVMSFTNPHPAQVLFAPEYKPLLTLKEQAYLLENRVDLWIPYSFSKSLAQMEAKEFCEMLQDKYSCDTLVVGENFRFGHNRQGTAESLQAFGMNVVVVPHLQFENEKVSTSQIREYLLDGKLDEANKLLGYHFPIIGTVAEGRKLGRTIGFPTANINLAEDKLLPPNGVYASKIKIQGIEKLGITNIGINPTVTTEGVRKAESYIFDFDEDIYGEELVVQLCHFIRPEQSFSGIDELKTQISIDVQIAIEWGNKNNEEF